MHTVLVLGGYGFFGGRIATALARESGIRLLVAGRNLQRAQATAIALGLDRDSGVAVDAGSADLAEKLMVLGVNTVVHTAGPFQGQDYAVARAAIAAGCHYMDLGDGRDFVTGIEQLNAVALARGVTVIGGASSVPGLSSAVVEHYLPQFAELSSIRIGISSGARAPGLATVRGIFTYLGKPFLRWEHGEWRTTHGWMDLQRYRFPAPLGTRLVGSCDVPDLALFPKCYPTARAVTFHAGFASSVGHLVVWAVAALVRSGLLRSGAAFAAPLNRASRWLEPVISDQGGMYVLLDGVGQDGGAKSVRWHLLAAENHGPVIPCGAAIALTKKLARGEALPRGAMPCVGLLTVEEYLAPLRHLSIREAVT